MREEINRDFNHRLERLSSLAEQFFPKPIFNADAVALIIRIVSPGASIRDFAGYLNLIDRTYGRLFPLGLRSYSRKKKEYLKITSLGNNSIELVVSQVLSHMNVPIYFILIFIFMKYLPRLIKVAGKTYKDYEEGRLTRTRRKYLENEISKIIPEITEKEFAKPHFTADTERELATVITELTEHDPALQQAAQRVITSFNVEIKLKLVSSADKKRDGIRRIRIPKKS